MNCEHCFEGAILNQKESLTLNDHQEIIAKLQASGVPMIQFGGGEPMNRLADLLTLLKRNMIVRKGKQMNTLKFYMVLEKEGSVYNIFVKDTASQKKK